jgi:uncharacterized protein YgiM (DUF1202 family)
MPRKKEITEETIENVSKENLKEEVRPERKRRAAKIIEEPVEEKKDSYVVVADILNVRFGPGYGYRIYKQIVKDTRVDVTNISNEFGEIEPGLWVAMKFLEKI